MLRLAVGAVCLTLLAGCSASPPQEPASTPTPSSATMGPPPAPIARTDTLHLLDAPHMAGALPQGGATVRTPVPSDVNNAQGAPIPAPAWTLPRPGLAELKVDLHLVVDVEGVVTNPPRGAGNCFWAIDFFLRHADGSEDGAGSYCRSEQPVVPAGVRALDFAFALAPDAAPLPGDLFGVRVATLGAYAPGGSVSILSGSADADSTLAIAGLQLPIGTTTLLA